jgi:gamma-glutamyltranspeptidase/glutathione hydrolase
MVTRPDGAVTHAVGTMGGDAQPQIILQLLARLLLAGEDPATAIAAARVVHEAPGAPPFRLWQAGATRLLMEAHAPQGWRDALEARGHDVRVVGAFNPVEVGCSQIISVDHTSGGPVLVGASDPRSPEGDAVGR